MHVRACPKNDKMKSFSKLLTLLEKKMKNVIFSKCPPWSQVSKNAAKTRFGTVFASVFDDFRFSLEAAQAADDGFKRAPRGLNRGRE